MGNFYTNFTVLGADRDETAVLVKKLRRRAFVIQGSERITVVFDEDSDEQDVDDIEQLGMALSEGLGAAVIGCLNHDDDHLLFWLFEGGEQRSRYESWLDAPRFAWSLSRVRGGLLAYPLILGILGWPVILFQFWRHRAVVSLLSLPSPSVGYGYTYLARGEVPAGLSEDDIKRV